MNSKAKCILTYCSLTRIELKALLAEEIVKKLSKLPLTKIETQIEIITTSTSYGTSILYMRLILIDTKLIQVALINEPYNNFFEDSVTPFLNNDTTSKPL